MWNKKSQMRNKFLQMQLLNKAQAINDYTDNEFQMISKTNYPVLRPRSIQTVKSRILGDERIKTAFGLWGLPKLMKEICSDDSKTQLCAMKMLSELVINDLECHRAISEYDIVRRLQNVLLRRRLQKHKDQKLVPIILRCYSILTYKLRAALQMSVRPNLIHEFYKMVERDEHQSLASKILCTLTQHPQVVDFFIRQTNWFNELSEILSANRVPLVDWHLLEHFGHFLEHCPQMAIERGFFELIFLEMSHKHHNQQILIKCFAFLLNCKEGQDKLDKADPNGVHVLYEILMDEQLESHEFVVQALQSATAGSQKSLWCCKELVELPYALIRRAHNVENERQQLYCIQTLRQITAVPSVKQFVRKICIPQIRNIDCRTINVEEAKGKLLVWLRKDVHDAKMSPGTGADLVYRS